MELDDCKERITANLQRDIDVDNASKEDLEQLVGPEELTALHRAIRRVKNPRKTLFAIHETMGELIAQLDEMLGAMGSGDEKLIEGGEGLKGDPDVDTALSGVVLYKGETVGTYEKKRRVSNKMPKTTCDTHCWFLFVRSSQLLELTERWRFIYDRLYDSETDRFDLSRIPDVHDNVRFEYVFLASTNCIFLLPSTNVVVLILSFVYPVFSTTHILACPRFSIGCTTWQRQWQMRQFHRNMEPR